MKMTKRLLTGVTAAAALTITAQAKHHKEPGKGKRHFKPSKELIEKFDKDGDGKLNDEERAALKAEMKERRQARRAKMLERFDTDKDGTLSDEEKKTARQTIRKENKEIREAVRKQFDKDADGKLSKEERQGVKEWVKENYPDAIMKPRRHRGHRNHKGHKNGDRDTAPEE